MVAEHYVRNSEMKAVFVQRPRSVRKFNEALQSHMLATHALDPLGSDNAAEPYPHR